MHLLAQDGPAVVLLVLDEVAVPALAPEVKGEAQAPRGHQHSHHSDADVDGAIVDEVVVRQEHPAVQPRGDRPDLVDLGAVAAKDGPDEGVDDEDHAEKASNRYMQ